MTITATHINYYFVCQRKLWLFSNNIVMEHESELVYEGKFIHEYSYPNRSEKFQEIEIAGSIIDFYDYKNKIIHEVKKSDKKEDAHVWQVKYYIFLLKQAGIEVTKGIIDYPELRRKEEVTLTENDENQLQTIINDIKNIISSNTCPPKINKTKCKNCSYFDFCWINEEN